MRLVNKENDIYHLAGTGCQRKPVGNDSAATNENPWNTMISKYILPNYENIPEFVMFNTKHNLLYKPDMKLNLMPHQVGFALLFLLTPLQQFGQAVSSADDQKNRVIILTDIEADPDDTQSLIRLLLYANQIDIKGIIATTSCWQKARIAPESIQKVIRAYGKVQPNLIKHEEGFPGYEELISLVKRGLPVYGMQGVGDGKDSEGSEWIIKTLEENDDRPLWISVWGGANTLAQALYKIKNTRSGAVTKRLTAKLRVYTISDQDDSGIWIRNNFPDLFYIVTPGDDYGSATWTGINTFVRGIDNHTISNKWLAENIQQGHGPLGALYPDVAYGVEGDTPAFLSLIPNGLSTAAHPAGAAGVDAMSYIRLTFQSLKREAPLFPMNLRREVYGLMPRIRIPHTLCPIMAGP